MTAPAPAKYPGSETLDGLFPFRVLSLDGSVPMGGFSLDGLVPIRGFSLDGLVPIRGFSLDALVPIWILIGCIGPYLRILIGWNGPYPQILIGWIGPNRGIFIGWIGPYLVSQWMLTIWNFYFNMTSIIFTTLTGLSGLYCELTYKTLLLVLKTKYAVLCKYDSLSFFNL